MSNILSANEKETLCERITELEKANQELRSEIFECKRVEKELREEEFRLHQAQELMESTTAGTDIIIAAIDTNFCYTYFNKAYKNEVQRLSGKKIHVGESMIETFANLPEQQKIILEQWSDVLQGKSTKRTLAFGDPDLFQRIYDVYHTPIRDDEGKIFGAGEVAYDVTEKVSIEEALRKSEERYRMLHESLRDIFVHVSMDGKIIEFNDLFCRMLGYAPEETLKLNYKELTPKRWHALEDDIVYKQIIPRGYSDVYEKEYRRKDGSIIPVELRTILSRDEAGRPNGMWAIVRDISERKKAEEALKKAYQNLEENVKERTAELEKAYKSLKESEKGLAEAQKMAHLGNWARNIKTGEVYWSNEVYRIFGFKPQEFGVTYDSFLSRIHPDDQDYVIKGAKKALEEKLSGIDYRIVLNNGEERIVHEEFKIIFDEKNIPVQLRGTIQDITENKKAEEKLRESEEKYRNIVETAGEGIFIIDAETKFTYANKKIGDMLGYTLKEIIGKTIWSFVSEESKPIVKLNQEKRCKGINQSYEMKLIKKDGFPLWVIVNAKALFDKNGRFIGSLSMLTDITKRKKAEETLVKIEKTRIREIHHRIKNNLQVISSLLDLQSEKFRDKEILEAFKESQNRVTSMALIHEELYKGKDIDTLDFAAYLRKLTANLLESYYVGIDKRSLKLDLEQAHFDMDTAIPLGIIVNELVSNALKHAFPDGKIGEIYIALKKVESLTISEEVFEAEDRCGEKGNFQYVLTVADNGKGIPEEINLQNVDSLGLQLINILTEQIDGKIEIGRDQGTKFTVWFNNIEK